MTEPRLADRLRALAALVPMLEQEDAVAAFGAWVPSSEREAGVWTMPYVEYGEHERTFRAATVGWVRPDIDWTRWGQTADALALRRDSARLERATPEDLAHLLTALVRGDRFNEGLLLDAFQQGLLLRIARRAAALLAAGD